jgi:hypothetical protein
MLSPLSRVAATVVPLADLGAPLEIVVAAANASFAGAVAGPLVPLITNFQGNVADAGVVRTKTWM